MLLLSWDKRSHKSCLPYRRFLLAFKGLLRPGLIGGGMTFVCALIGCCAKPLTEELLLLQQQVLQLPTSQCAKADPHLQHEAGEGGCCRMLQLASSSCFSLNAHSTDEHMDTFFPASVVEKPAILLVSHDT